MTLLVNNVLLALTPLTLEPQFALNVDAVLKPMKTALLVNSVKRDHSALITANVNYVQRIKSLIPLELADAILVEQEQNPVKIRLLV